MKIVRTVVIESKKGTYKRINLREAPWYIFFLDWIVGLLCEIAYSTHPWIALPPVVVNWRPWDYKDKFERWELNSIYCGLGGWFHSYVHDPVFYFCYDRTKTTKIK